MVTIRRKKLKGATDRSVAPWLCTLPRYYAKPNLLHRGVSDASRVGRNRSSVEAGGEANDAIFVGAEATHARLVERCRCAADGVADGQVRIARGGCRTNTEVVAALGSTSGDGVGQH